MIVHVSCSSVLEQSSGLSGSLSSKKRPICGARILRYTWNLRTAEENVNWALSSFTRVRMHLVQLNGMTNEKFKNYVH